MTFKRSISLALGLGALGLFFRLSIWSMAYDSGTKLILKPTLVLLFNLFFALCGVVAALLFYLRWPQGGMALFPYESRTPLRRLLRVAAALASSAAGGLLLYQLLQEGGAGMVLLVCGGLMAAQGLFLLLLTLLRPTERLGYATLLLFPAFAGCFFNIGMYQQLGAEPNPQVYMWPVLSMLFSAAAWVAYAGFAYQYQSGRGFGLLAHLALLTLPVALAAPLPLAWRVYLCSPLLWFWSALLSLRAALPDTALDGQETAGAPEDDGNAPLSATITVVEEDPIPPVSATKQLPANGDAEIAADKR